MREKSENAAREPLNFLVLPLEIRLEIYRHVLLQPKWIPAWSKDPYPGRPRSGLTRSTVEDRFGFPYPKLHHSLLATCSQIHEEASKVLYGENTFCIEDGPVSDLWDVKISAQYKPLICRFRVEIYVYLGRLLSETSCRVHAGRVEKICRSLCKYPRPIRSLTVNVVDEQQRFGPIIQDLPNPHSPRGVIDDHWWHDDQGRLGKKDMFAPFAHLKDVRSFEIKGDIPDRFAKQLKIAVEKNGSSPLETILKAMSLAPEVAEDDSRIADVRFEAISPNLSIGCLAVASGLSLPVFSQSIRHSELV